MREGARFMGAVTRGKSPFAWSQSITENVRAQLRGVIGASILRSVSWICRNFLRELPKRNVSKLFSLILHRWLGKHKDLDPKSQNTFLFDKCHLISLRLYAHVG